MSGETRMEHPDVTTVSPERRLLAFLLGRNEQTALDNYGDWEANNYQPILMDDAVKETGLTNVEIQKLLSKFILRGWIASGGAIGTDESVFFGGLTHAGLDEAEMRAQRIAIHGPVTIAIASVGALHLGVNESDHLRRLLEQLGGQSDKETKAGYLRQVFALLSDATTVSDGLFRFLPLLASIAAQIY